MLVREHDTRLFRHITNRNLLWQYDFLMDAIRIGLPKRLKLDRYLIDALNFFAVVNLSETPGDVRDGDVYIEGAVHQPPEHHRVKDDYLNFIVELHQLRPRLDALHVAAYVLWKINWIHPFDEGNGRTARAAMYYALSLKLERMLPGSISIPAQLRKRPRLYYQHLATIDASVKETGNPNLGPLADYLGKLLDRQLQS